MTWTDGQVTDARATMALYRLHKTEWEQSIRPTTEAYKAKVNKAKGKEKDTGTTSGKRKRDDESEYGEDIGSETQAAQKGGKGKKIREEFPGGGRKGVSSGLSVVIRRNGKRIDGPRQRGVPRGSTGQSNGAGSSGGSWWEEV